MASKTPVAAKKTTQPNGLQPKGVKPKGVQPNQLPSPVLKLVFFIVDWHNAEEITKVLDKEKVRLHFIIKGRGTSNSDILDILGMESGDKAIAVCLEQEVLIPVLMKEAQKRFGFHNPGAGIVFTIPLSAINSPILRSYKQSVLKNKKIKTHLTVNSDKGEKMSKENHELIVAIINQGYSDELMNTARAAGASGGTIIHARGQAHEGVVKFFGVSVQDEKEMVIILSSKKNRTPIMRAVSEVHGLNSPAHGIVLSVPVEDVLGLNN